jgi:hypothetical protein
MEESGQPWRPGSAQEQAFDPPAEVNLISYPLSSFILVTPCFGCHHTRPKAD